MALSYLFHSYPFHVLYGNQAILSLFSSHLPRQVLYFCFFEEEDRKIIKKGLPFFLAFLWIVGVPVDVNVTDSLSVFLSILPTINSCFPLALVNNEVQKKVRKVVENQVSPSLLNKVLRFLLAFCMTTKFMGNWWWGGIHKIRCQAKGRGGLAKCQRYYIIL